MLLIDEHQDRVGNQPRQRNEIGAGGLGLSSEQLVDFLIAGNPVVMREQRIAVRFGIGADLRADLTAGARFGLDHDRLSDDRLERRSKRPRHDIVQPHLAERH